MQRKQISSSRICSIGYEASSQTLEVEFNTGGIMPYCRVSADLHRRLMSASSLVSFFEDHIQEAFSE